MLQILKNSQKSRERMVERQIAGRGITDTYVLEAMKTVPREQFMPETVASYAYDDMPAPIGKGQTISQPYIVALMAELADIEPENKVLEVGTGSGYGAAILSQIAEEVYTVERHPELAEQARERLLEIGYNNVNVVTGDGTLGYLEEAPFDAIIVTAGGPRIPETLKAQLEIGGRLIMPVGDQERRQELVKITRVSDVKFETENFGGVLFVPLIGEEGWGDKEDRRKRSGGERSFLPGLLKDKAKKPTIIKMLERDAEPLPAPDSPHFGKQFDRLAEADIVLLGESTHGTEEFYRARSLITQRLVEKHGFNIVAFEADWPDMAVIDGYLRGRNVPNIKMQPFSRFPEWMWRNEEFALFIDWMKKYNDRQDSPEDKAGFYGLDLYSLQASINAVIDFLEDKDPELAEIARKRYECFMPWLDDPVNYGRHATTDSYKSCRQGAVNMMMELMEARLAQKNGTPDEELDVIRNAIVVADAEEYYRSIYMGETSSWNLRDKHMFNTLRAVMKSRGPDSKAVVWAHNSHIGDARATDMGAIRGELNLGQLCRENYGDKARLVGFGTAEGEVSAASRWGGEREIVKVRTPIPGSHERLWHDSDLNHALLDLTGALDDDLRKELEDKRLQRAIGVIYRPESERISHYYNARPGRQYDYYVWFEKTNALKPLPYIEEESGEDDTYPFGL